jgi:hypothetical protein
LGALSGITDLLDGVDIPEGPNGEPAQHTNGLRDDLNDLR